MSNNEEPEIATKAPESDAMEDSSSHAAKSEPAHDEPVTGTASTAAMSEHCVTDRPLAAGASSSGEIAKMADIDVYISKPSDYPHVPSKLLLLLSSGTGIHSTNNQLQADAFAKEGFVVVMPDQFGNDPAPNTSDVNEAREEAGSSVLEQVKLHATEAVQSFMIDMWLARQTPEKVLPRLEKVINSAKEEFADAFASGGGLYTVGYCFGGKYVLQLAQTEAAEPGKSEGQEQDESKSLDQNEAITIKAGALAHGTSITSQDFQNVRAPICIVAVENDQLFPDEHLKAGEKILQEEGIDHETKVYAEVPHGFAVVGDYEDAKIKQSQKEAFEQMLAWLKKY